MPKQKDKEIDDLLIKADRLAAEGFICRVELNCLLNLGNRDKLISDFLKIKNAKTKPIIQQQAF